MRALGLGRIWGGSSLYRGEGIEVRERNGVRTLHLATDTVQSAMRLDRPDALELSYTRAMMAFLLFSPPPGRLLLIGLGGGSLAKFVHRSMPETFTTAVEINPGVVEIARLYFGLPEECARLRCLVGDGAAYLADGGRTVDALLVDAYDGETLARGLATQAFFRDARRALSAAGVFAMNLWANDRAFERNLGRIERAFDGLCLCLPAERPGNVIVLGLARKPEPGSLSWTCLYERAALLEVRFGLEFPAFVSELRRMNRHDASGLFPEDHRLP